MRDRRSAVAVRARHGLGGPAPYIVALPAIVGALAFSLLNPQVHVETMATVGVGAMRVAPGQRWLFGLGAALTSPLWFFGIVLGARRVAPVLGRGSVRRGVDAAAALAMVLMALAIAGGAVGG